MQRLKTLLDDLPVPTSLLGHVSEIGHWLSPFLRELINGNRDLTILSISERQTA